MADAAPLSLHHLTVLELSAVQLIDLAADLGCSHVGLFTCLPPGLATRFPCVGDERQEAEVAERLATRGVGLNNAEVFAIREGLSVQSYSQGLQRAARLGARVATVHVHGSCDERALADLGRFCDLAAEQGLRAALEFTGFSAVRSLQEALDVLDRLQHPAACIALDALHFFRNGGQPALLRSVARERIGYLQLCDGPLAAPEDPYREAVAERQVPGRGEFPLAEMLAQLEGGVLLDVEVPRESDRISGLGAVERAATAVEAARDIMRQVHWRHSVR